jgi:hypothetical protein
VPAAQLKEELFGDPRWRLNNLYSIVDKKGRAVPFRPNWAQQEVIEGLHNRNLILKARQLGITTLCCLVYLDDCIFTPNVQAAVIAHKLDDAKVIFKNKVKFPYDNLDEGIRNAVPVTQDSADTLALGNNSALRVSTSTRSGTVNWLHVSEYGKICAQFPDKAEEIRSGAFPSAEHGIITIESTAEGEGGDFHQKSVESQELALREATLTRKDFRFFFFPWWREPTYTLERTNVPVSQEDTEYFDALEKEAGTVLTHAQRNWWVTEERQQGGNMKREYPATPKEAFEQAIEGAIFADDIAAAYKHKRIGTFPFDKTRPVNTFWDLGFNDETAIWLEQDNGAQPTFIQYYENSGEGIEHYLRWLKAWADEREAVFAEHYVPHDGDRKTIWTPEGTMVVMARLGFRPKVVGRHPDKWEAIKIGRRKFSTVTFDEAGCKEGLQRLKAYRKEWDEHRLVWRDKPHHGPESNGADAYLTFAQSGHTPNAPVLGGDDRHKRRFYDREDEAESWSTY